MGLANVTATRTRLNGGSGAPLYLETLDRAGSLRMYSATRHGDGPGRHAGNDARRGVVVRRPPGGAQVRKRDRPAVRHGEPAGRPARRRANYVQHYGLDPGLPHAGEPHRCGAVPGIRLRHHARGDAGRGRRELESNPWAVRGQEPDARIPAARPDAAAAACRDDARGAGVSGEAEARLLPDGGRLVDRLRQSRRRPGVSVRRNAGLR
jgi:hypothetical protein